MSCQTKNVPKRQPQAPTSQSMGTSSCLRGHLNVETWLQAALALEPALLRHPEVGSSLFPRGGHLSKKISIFWRSDWMIFKSPWNQWLSESRPWNCLALNWHSVLLVWSPNINVNNAPKVTVGISSCHLGGSTSSTHILRLPTDLVGTTPWPTANQLWEGVSGRSHVLVF